MRMIKRKKGEKMKVSACIITKNEERNIHDCLESLEDCADEIIVVDTGSADNTVQIAERHGAKIYRYPWGDDFSAVKNFAIEQASGDWIVFLDADEYFTKQTRAHLRAAIEQCAPDSDVCGVKIVNIDSDDQNRVMDYFYKIRIFRNGTMRYQGKIHEDLVDTKGKKSRYAKIDPEMLTIYHTGYSSGRFKDKCERNLKLLLAQLNGTPSDAEWYGYLADVYYGLKQYEQAAAYAIKAIKMSPKEISYASRPYRIWINSLRNMKAPDEQIQEAVEAAIAAFADLPDFYFEKSLLEYGQGKYESALFLLQKAFDRHSNYTAIETTLFDKDIDLAERVAAQIYEMKQDFERAQAYYQRILSRNKYDPGIFRSVFFIRLAYDPIETIAYLNRIYDRSSLEDMQFLVEQIALVKKNKVLFYYINQKKKLLGEESVDIDQLLFLRRHQQILATLDDLEEYIKFYTLMAIVCDQDAVLEREIACLPEQNQRVIRRFYLGRDAKLGEEDFPAYKETFFSVLHVDEREIVARYCSCAADFSSEEILELAEILMENFYTKEAVELYQVVLMDKNPAEPKKIYACLGYCYYKLGLFHEAKRYLARVSGEKNRKVESYLNWIREKERVNERNLNQ